MALDFGILQPANISGQLQAGQESAMRNQLAQQQLAAGQQQMETGRMQQEKAGLEMQQFKRRQAALDQFLAHAEKGGQTGDPEEVAQNFYKFAVANGEPQVLMAAQQALMAAKERKQYLSERMPGGAPAPGAPALNVVSRNEGVPRPVPAGSEDRLGDFISQIEAKQNAPMPMPAVTGRPIQPDQALNVVSRSEGSPSPIPSANMLAPATAAPVNALAAPAPAPAAPVNALAAPAPAAADPAAALQNKIIDLQMRYPSGAAKTEIGMLTKQLEAMQKLHVVGDSLLNGAGQVVATVPKTATLSEFERLLEKSNLTPDQQIQAKQAWIAKHVTHAPGTSVSVKLPPLEGAEQKGKGEYNVKAYATVAQNADLSRKLLPALEVTQSILDKGFNTGWGSETVTGAARVLGALGVEGAKNYATDAQTFLAQGRQALLQRQLEQKGAQSEGDAARMEQTFVQLGNTVDANKFLVASAKAQAKQSIAQQKFFDGWWNKNKTYEGAETAWVNGDGGKSIFDYPEMKAYAPKGAPSAPPSSVRNQADAILRGGTP